MTYVWKGRQYVVIAAGGHAKSGTANGDSVVAFRWPGRENAFAVVELDRQARRTVLEQGMSCPCPCIVAVALWRWQRRAALRKPPGSTSRL